MHLFSSEQNSPFASSHEETRPSFRFHECFHNAIIINFRYSYYPVVKFTITWNVMISLFEMNYCVVKAIQNLLVVLCAPQYTTHSRTVRKSTKLSFDTRHPHPLISLSLLRACNSLFLHNFAGSESNKSAAWVHTFTSFHYTFVLSMYMYVYTSMYLSSNVILLNLHST